MEMKIQPRLLPVNALRCLPAYNMGCSVRVMTFGDRLRDIRKQRGLTQAELAEISGVSQQLISKLERTRAKTSSAASKLAKALGVDVKWLLFGEYPAKEDDSLVLEQGPEPGKIDSVPVVGNTQAGPDKEWFELGYPPGYGEDYVDVPAKDPHAYALRVVGDSMEPRMHEGELVLVYPSWEAQPGDEVVVRTQRGEVMVKKLVYIRNGRMALDSVAEHQGRIERDLDEIEFMHPVVGVLRPASLKRRGK